MERILIVFAVLFGFAHASIAQGEYEQSVLFTNVMVWDGTSKALRKADVLVSGSGGDTDPDPDPDLDITAPSAVSDLLAAFGRLIYASR